MASASLIATAYKGPVGPLRHRCAYCEVTGTELRRCAGCHAVRYCSRDHQVVHRPRHKAGCKEIKKARAKLASEEDAVRNATPDFMRPANAFETGVGHFWGLLHTRDYMRARIELAGSNLALLGTLDGVQEALEHMRDMLRLCRRDALGVRDTVPYLMLRLDLDQQCYDFVKWWATCDPDGRYDWGNMSLPYLNVRGADAFEDPGFLLGKYPQLNHLVAILLLKLKLIVDICSLKTARKVLAQTRLPSELWAQIELDVLRSPLSANLQGLSHSSLIKTEIKLRQQACKIGATIVQANPNFMFALFDPDELLAANVESYSPGSLEETVLAMQYSYAAWWETEGVLDLLADARACAARDSDDEIKDMMKVEVARGNPRPRTAAEILEDVGVNRMWAYLSQAIQNASYLGPWNERPSERHYREVREFNARMREEDGDFYDSSDLGEWSDDEA